MEEKYRKKYRIKSARLKNWDYSSNGYYFVTICTKDKKCYFENNNIKKIAEKCWLEIPQHFKITKLDLFVIMPNHLHGIIIIENKNVETDNVETDNVETDYNLSLPRIAQKQNKFQNVICGSISYIIAGYKSAVTRMTKKSSNLPFFAWQDRFYDHIIGDDKSLNNIRRYILENPLKWEIDIENPNVSQRDVSPFISKEYYKKILYCK